MTSKETIKETIKDDRKNVNEKYGKNLADKASNEFCLAYGLIPKHMEHLSFTEAVPTVQPRAAVLEFASSEKKIEKERKNYNANQ